MHALKVGELYSPTRTKWPEAAQYNFDANGHTLELFFPSPSDVEIAAVKAPGKEYALTLYQGAIFLLYRLPGNPNWSDCPFSVWLIPADRRQKPDMSGRASLVTNLLIDADTGILKVINACNWTRDFTRTLHDAIDKQMRTGFDPAKHAKIVDAAYRKWETADAMAADAIARCVGGAEIDTDEPLRSLPPDTGRRQEVAVWVSLDVSEVESVPEAEALAWIKKGPDPNVYEACKDNPALYWRAVGRLFVDDPMFGPVVPVDELVYDSEIGLHHPGWLKD